MSSGSSDSSSSGSEDSSSSEGESEQDDNAVSEDEEDIERKNETTPPPKSNTPLKEETSPSSGVSLIFIGLKGTATLMISMFIRKSSINHEFWYKYHQNRLKNGQVMGI